MDKETTIKNWIKETYFDSIWAIRNSRTPQNFLWEASLRHESILEEVHPLDLRIWVQEAVNDCEALEIEAMSEEDKKDYYTDVDDYAKGIYCV